jgi:hypothetical protein
MVGEDLEEPRTPGQDDFPIPDPLLRRVQGLGPVDLDDVLLLVPLVGALLALVEVVEPHMPRKASGKGTGRMDLRERVDHAAGDLKPSHEIVEGFVPLGRPDIDDLALGILLLRVLPPAHDDVKLSPRVHAHRAGAIGPIQEPRIPAEGQHLMRRELVLDVHPRDPDLQRIRSARGCRSFGTRGGFRPNRSSS